MNTIELRFQLQFLKKGLPNFFEKVSARLQGYVTYRQDWKNGIYATRNKTRLLLTRKKNSGLICVTLSVRGADLQELWLLILTLRADMNNLLQVYFELGHEISNNVVCTTNKASDQPAHSRSLIRAFASR